MGLGFFLGLTEQENYHEDLGRETRRQGKSLRDEIVPGVVNIRGREINWEDGRDRKHRIQH